MAGSCLHSAHCPHTPACADGDPRADLLRRTEWGCSGPREEVYASLSTLVAFWDLSGLTRGIVRASASVRPTRCPAHPHAQTKQFISVRYLPQCAQLLIRPRWTPTKKVSALRLCGGCPPRLAQTASLAASREGESSTVTCPGGRQALHSRFLSCRLWASEKQHLRR